MILLIDNYDSFSYNLFDYVKQTNSEVIVLKNDDSQILTIELPQFDGIIISPGPGRPENAGFLMEFLNQSVGKLPILGVCLGYQALGIHAGISLSHASQPVHGKSSEIKVVHDHSIFKDLPSKFHVGRYHSLNLIYQQQAQLNWLAFTNNNEPMAFELVDKDAVGLLFHPESILTEHGLQIIKNWIKGL